LLHSQQHFYASLVFHYWYHLFATLALPLVIVALSNRKRVPSLILPPLPRFIASAKHTEGMSTLKGHSDVVWSVAFSPSGARIASGSRDKTVRIWALGTKNMKKGGRVHTHECMMTLGLEQGGHLGTIYGVSYSDDAKTVATVGRDQTIKIWGR
jgi:WD40 repeat protein